MASRPSRRSAPSRKQRLPLALLCLLGGCEGTLEGAPTAPTELALVTTSTSASWAPTTIVNRGETLRWAVSGGVTLPEQVADMPTLDLSGNTGTARVTLSSDGELAGLEEITAPSLEITEAELGAATDLVKIDLYDNALTTLDLSANVALETIWVQENALTSLDISQNPQASFVALDANALSTFDVSANPALLSLWLNDNRLAGATLDAIVNALDGHGLSDGELRIADNSGVLSSAALEGYDSLVARGWTIDVPRPLPGTECDPGYHHDGAGCVDDDECAAGTHDCHAQATCTNQPGSYVCTCMPGFTGDGRTCTEGSLPGLELTPLKAFPTAQGGGSNATGGRGGRILHVTHLGDSGPGSLREALMTEGPRIIVFDVSGRIHLGSRISLRTSRLGDFTVAGQTAPEGGITISGRPIELSNSGGDMPDNFIFRFIRFRNGSYTGESDAYDHNGVIIHGGVDFVFDHCSFSFCDDQAMSMAAKWNDLRNVTVQRSLFSENATGVIAGLGSGDPTRTEDISFVRNLWVHQSHRTPNIGTQGGYTGRFDALNNVMFNWQNRLINANTGSPHLNNIGNYYLPGDYTSTANGGTANKIQTGSAESPLVYTAYNYHPGFYPTPQLDDRDVWQSFTDNSSLPARYFTSTRFPLLPNTSEPLSAADAYEDVLGDVGANRYVDDAGSVQVYQDSYDLERIEDVRSRTSRDPFNKSWTQPSLPTRTRPAGWDGRVDGIPDAFVEAHGITSRDDVILEWVIDGQPFTNTAGYDAMDMYLAYAAGDLDAPSAP
ncbi:MAG: hypothetical protein SangKO_054620 [Sandaracinaceae bacterium]